MKLLFVDCCISQRGPRSRTRALCEAFLETYQQTHPQARIETVDLQQLALPPFDCAMLDARDALRVAGDFNAPVFALARQFCTAEHILVGAPFWDLSFPAALRIYIEHISANGISYYYDEQGCHGACAARRLAFLTSGGDREQPQSLGVLYWQQLCAMFGIPRFDHVFAGSLDLDPAQTPALLAAACQDARSLAAGF